MNTALVASSALAVVGSAGVVFGGNDAIARPYKQVTKRDLMDQTIASHRRSKAIKAVIFIFSIPVCVSGILSGVSEEVGWTRWALGRVIPGLADASVVPTPPAVPPCEDESAFKTAEEEGYQSLNIYFRNCPFITSRTERFAQAAAQDYDRVSQYYLSIQQPELASDASSRGGDLAVAMMTFDTVHRGPESKILIDWPDPQSISAKFRLPPIQHPSPAPHDDMTPADVRDQISQAVDQGTHLVNAHKCGSAKKMVEQGAQLLLDHHIKVDLDKPTNEFQRSIANEFFGLVRKIDACNNQVSPLRDKVCARRADTRGLTETRERGDFIRECNLELSKTTQDFQ